MIENTFYQILANMTDISVNIAGRIYYEFNPNQDESQYLIYQKISHSRTLNADGLEALQSADFQIDIYSPGEDVARNIRDALVTNLHGKSNTTYADNVQQIYVESDSSGFVNDPDLYRITLSISVYF